MRSNSIAIVLFLVLTVWTSAQEEVTGLWKGTDRKNKENTMFVYIYQYMGKIYGRMVATFVDGVPNDNISNPVIHAEKWDGNPSFLGMDIIWNLEKRGSRWRNGKICDPRRGRIYDSQIWRAGEDLIVRGQLGPFGQNNVWNPVHPHELPPNLDYGDPAAWIPVIPKRK